VLRADGGERVELGLQRRQRGAQRCREPRILALRERVER
jgi:hypothetical protein